MFKFWSGKQQSKTSTNSMYIQTYPGSKHTTHEVSAYNPPPHICVQIYQIGILWSNEDIYVLHVCDTLHYTHAHTYIQTYTSIHTYMEKTTRRMVKFTIRTKTTSSGSHVKCAIGLPRAFRIIYSGLHRGAFRWSIK